MISEQGSHISLERQRAAIQILTGEKALDQLFVEYELQCVSDRSLELEGAIRHTFRINFVDECYDTRITPAFNDDVTIPLFQFFYESMINYSSQTLDCAPIRYSMFIRETTAIEPVRIFWNLDYNDYEVNPDKFNNRGVYTLLLRSCVPVGTENVCVFSPSWVLTIYDPC